MARILVEDISQNENQWLLQKRVGIGSGDIATICGANDFQTPLALWSVKTGREKPDDENTHMWWGKQQETPIARLCAKEMKMMLVHANTMFGHDTVKWAQATPDFFALPSQPGEPEGEVQFFPPGVDLEEELRIMEVKNVGWRKKADWSDGKTPLAPLMQTQWQMGICGYKHGVIAPMVGGDIMDFSPRTLDFDETIFNQLLELASKFMWYVTNDTPPAPTSKDTRLVENLIGDLTDKTAVIEPSPEHLQRVKTFFTLQDEYNALKEKSDAAKAAMDEQRNFIRLLMGNATRATCGDFYMTAKRITVKAHQREASAYTDFLVRDLTPTKKSEE